MSESRAESILVVDDNEANRYTLSRILRKEGFEVHEAGDGLEGLRMAAMHPDLFILDVRMPGMDGHELVRRLKADAGTQPIPILQISATFTTPGDVAYGLQTGADGYLTHPVDPLVLVATVRAFLRARQAEQLLYRAAREWRATFDALADGVCLLDKAGRIIRCNQATTQLLNRPFAEIVDARLDDLLPQLRDAGLISGAALVDQGRTTAEVPHGDAWFRMTIDPATDEQGKAWGAVVALTDVTAARFSEQGVRESEERFRTLATAFGGVVWRTDNTGKLLGPAEGWEALTGKTAEAIRQGGWSCVCHPEDAPRIDQQWAESLATGKNFAAECRIRRADGAYATVQWLGVPIRSAVGDVTEWIGTLNDISDRRSAEEQVRRIQRMDTIGRLAGGIAHETNNQMTVVLGFSDFVLQSSNLNEDQRQDLVQIRRAASRVAHLTRQLLAFSRRQVLQPEELDLDAVLREAHAVLIRVLGPEVDLTMEIDPGPKWIRADRTQLIQILLNLCLNAHEAMPNGGSIVIGTRRATGPEGGGRLNRLSASGGDIVMLSVTDTGIGMEPSVLPHIFEPFFSTKGVGEGTGLGLSVVEGIVAQSGGDIWVTSEKGQGTVVTLAFPLAEPPPGTIAPGAPAGVAEGSLGESLLLVDDEDAVRSFLARGLSQAGYEVLTASNGEEALQLVDRRGGRIDLIISDLAMPGMHGKELAREVARRWPAVPFLFVSGHPRESVAQDRMGDLPGRFLQKPFTFDALHEAVCQALAQRPGKPQEGHPAY